MLVAVVQSVGRLIQHQHPRPLGQRTGNQRHLPLAAADFGVGTLTQMGDPHPFQRLSRHLPVRGAITPEKSSVGHPPHQHDIKDPIAKRLPVDLGDIGEPPGPLLRRHTVEILSVKPHRSGTRAKDAEHQFEQGGLAAAVGAEQRQHPPFVQIE